MHTLISQLFLVGYFGAPVEMLSEETRACFARVDKGPHLDSILTRSFNFRDVDKGPHQSYSMAGGGGQITIALSVLRGILLGRF